MNEKKKSFDYLVLSSSFSSVRKSKEVSVVFKLGQSLTEFYFFFFWGEARRKTLICWENKQFIVPLLLFPFENSDNSRDFHVREGREVPNPHGHGCFAKSSTLRYDLKSKNLILSFTLPLPSGTLRGYPDTLRVQPFQLLSTRKGGKRRCL